MKKRTRKRKVGGVAGSVEWQQERHERCARRLEAYRRKISELERQARDLI
jgi:hypothetical protein